MAPRRDVVQFIASYVVICAGCGLLPFLVFRWFPFLGLLGIFFLILGTIGLFNIRRRGMELKRTNPELFEKMRAESKKRTQEKRAREVHFSDFPSWLMALLIVAVAISFMDEIGLFRFSGSLETLFTILTVAFLAYYFLYKRKIGNRKKEKLSNSQMLTGEKECLVLVF